LHPDYKFAMLKRPWFARGHSWKLVKNYYRCNTRLQFFLSAIRKPLELFVWRWCWCAISELFQKSSWEKKKQSDGLL